VVREELPLQLVFKLRRLTLACWLDLRRGGPNIVTIREVLRGAMDLMKLVRLSG
jgi:hypothetical protein